MKKRCTNNKCRKAFVVKIETVCCPYCSKKYPRLHDAASIRKSDEDRILQEFLKANMFGKSMREALDLRILLADTNSKKMPKGIYLMDFANDDKIKIIKIVRKWTGRGIKESKELVESAPVLIEASEIVFNHLNSSMNELTGEWIIPDGSPLECFTKELDETGCLYKIIYNRRKRQ